MSKKPVESEEPNIQDPVSDLLRRLGFSASVFFRSEYCGRWAVDTSGSRQIPFHLVTHGEGWLHSANGIPQRLLAGQLALFPNDTSHYLASSDRPPAPDIVNQPPPDVIEGPVTRLICGYFAFTANAEPLLASLPSTMIVDLGKAESASTRELVQLWMREAAEDWLGNDLAVDRFAELVFIHMLRGEIASGHLGGMMGALTDDRLGPVLTEIHANPGNDHSLVSMADKARMSESAFAQRFKKATGINPGAYVRSWRMHQAAQMLTETQRTMLDIAQACGYDSEVAFRKAFSATMGTAPGKYRRNHPSTGVH